MLSIFGGIGIFLLGMTMLTNGLKEIAGDALKRWLNKFTKGIFTAILSGAVMTILIQSSTATTLLTIGFVSAGLLTFAQSIGVIIGANIGSTSTGLLISLVGFKISLQALSLPIISLGVFMTYIAPNRIKKFGNVLTGFGLLFLGIDLLQHGMSNAQNLINFQSMRSSTIIGVLILIVVGIVMTVIMQASSAAMAATLAALFTGTITFEQAAYLVIGQNVGTTATALFASIGASVSAKRTAMMHLLFNLVTAVLIAIIFPYFLGFSKWVTKVVSGGFDEPLGLAIFHILFSVFGMLIFVPFIKQFAKLLEKVIPERVNTITCNLDESLLDAPSIAIEVSYKALRDMIIVITDAQHILITNKKVTDEFEKKKREVEEAIVQLRPFVSRIHAINSRDREKLIVLLHSLDHLARLTKVLNDDERMNAINNQQRLMADWYGVLTEIRASINDDQQLEHVATRLEETSQKMAMERRNRRKQYFVRTAQDDAQLDVVISKVEALFWIDRLIFHYWRATARLAELHVMNINN